MKKTSFKKKPELTRAELEKQVHSFLNKGGKIKKIPLGTSGVDASQGQRHITISTKK